MAGRTAPRRATIVDVAKLAGVSIKTVSRVTNSEPNVRPEVRQRVAVAISRLGYRPMQSARGLAARRSGLLAMAYGNATPGYLIRVQHAARQCCEEAGYRLLLHPCDHRDPRLPGELVQLAGKLRLEGLLLVPPVSHDEAVIAALQSAGVPFSLLAPQRAPEGACAVLLDDERGGTALASYLIDLGHRRIGFVRGHPDHAASRARLAGFQRAMRKASLPVDAALVVEGDFTFESGRTAGAELLDRRTRPSAIIACNDDMAAGVIAAAHDRGLDIPASLAVCGFDDTPLASMLWPPLTTMHQPIGELSTAATRLLIEHIHSGRVPAGAVTLRHELVVRASTAGMPATGPA